jgi:hypothetical protein
MLSRDGNNVILVFVLAVNHNVVVVANIDALDRNNVEASLRTSVNQLDDFLDVVGGNGTNVPFNLRRRRSSTANNENQHNGDKDNTADSHRSNENCAKKFGI